MQEGDANCILVIYGGFLISEAPLSEDLLLDSLL